ncbi:MULTISPECIES: hypothetical protein [Chitinophagaceae]
MAAQIKYFTPYAGIHYNISKETETLISFIIPTTDEDFSFPDLVIYWKPYLDHNQAMSIWKAADGLWTGTVAAFYGAGVISDIRVLDINK